MWDENELYHLQTDPNEMHNLINDPEYKDILKKVREKFNSKQQKIRDSVFMKGQ